MSDIKLVNYQFHVLLSSLKSQTPFEILTSYLQVIQAVGLYANCANGTSSMEIISTSTSCVQVRGPQGSGGILLLVTQEVSFFVEDWRSRCNVCILHECTNLQLHSFSLKTRWNQFKTNCIILLAPTHWPYECIFGCIVQLKTWHRLADPRIVYYWYFKLSVSNPKIIQHLVGTWTIASQNLDAETL